MKNKVKKPTIRELQKTLKMNIEVIEQLYRNQDMLREQIKILEIKLRQKTETDMMTERVKLANSLGQMIEATSKAIMFIVAKEQM